MPLWCSLLGGPWSNCVLITVLFIPTRCYARVNGVQVQGAALDRVAKKSVKVLIVGNPANTNVRIPDWGSSDDRLLRRYARDSPERGLWHAG